MALRLGLLGPIIVLVGAAVAGVGAWYVVHARPKVGAVIDTFRVDAKTSLVVRAEDGGPGDRSFVELRSGDEVVWQALIPHYVGTRGRPAIAWTDNAVTVRVERGGRAEVFALAMRDSTKLGGLRFAQDHEPITTQAAGPITLTDHVRSYELVGGDGWHQIVAVDLRTGIGLWKVDLGPDAVIDGGVDGAIVWIAQASRRRQLDTTTGREVSAN